jgi:hypothetical protein
MPGSPRLRYADLDIQSGSPTRRVRQPAEDGHGALRNTRDVSLAGLTNCPTEQTSASGCLPIRETFVNTKNDNPTPTPHDDAVDRWLDIDLATSTDTQVGKILDELERTTPRPRSGPNRAHPPSGTLLCPMPSTWRAWDLFGLTYRGDLAPESEARIAIGRRMRRGRALRTLRLRWELAADDASIRPLTIPEVAEPSRWGEGTPSHVHTEFALDGRTVHIDVMAATKYGPGRSYWEARIFIDGQLAGRGGGGGCSLGGGGDDLPACALLNDGIVIAVSDGRTGWPAGYDAASQRPLVQLYAVRSRAVERPKTSRGTLSQRQA